MLWALAQIGSLSAQRTTVDPDSGELLDITLILEPEKGGDQQEESASHRVVEQLKSRSGYGTWSLQELVTEVLPDLYRAVDLGHPNTVYRFVTEGRIGGWQHAYRFFGSLKTRVLTGDVLANLDDHDEVRFQKQVPKVAKDKATFWSPEPSTSVASLNTLSTTCGLTERWVWRKWKTLGGNYGISWRTSSLRRAQPE